MQKGKNQSQNHLIENKLKKSNHSHAYIRKLEYQFMQQGKIRFDLKHQNQVQILALP